MKFRNVRSIFAGVLALGVVLLSGGVATGNTGLRADSVNLFFDPDRLGESQSMFDYYSAKKHVYMYREIVPIDAGAYTYFAILGANGGYPDFYGGIQLFKDGSKAAIFSAWDVGADGACWTCLPGTAAPEKQVSVFAKGSRTVTKPFGYEGTGMNSMIHGFDWKLNQKVGMLASIEPSGSGSLISAAFKNGDEPWEFMTSFYVPTKYEVGMSAGYSFVEDWVAGDSMVKRSYLAGPTYLEDNVGKGAHYTNVYVAANNPTGDGTAVRHAIEVQGEWLKVTTGIGVQENAKTQRVQLAKPKRAPDIAAGKAVLEGIIGEKSNRIKDNNQKAAQEKADAEAKAAADKAAAEAKAAADAAIRAKSTTITCLNGAQLRIVTAVKPKCPTGFRIQKTILCVKGKEIQRVSAVTPRCPAGFKRR